MIISRTPFRVSFFGGGTDFPDYYHEHGGVTLLTAINKYCYISIHHLSRFFQHRYRASYSRTESVVDPQEFQHPLVRECLLHCGTREGLEISHVADLPGRTGLGSSSSFTVGLLHALNTFAGQRVTEEDLAREAIHIERVRVGDSGGHQDQYAAAYGGFIRVSFGPGPGITVTRLPLSAARVRAIEDHTMMFFTGVESSAENVLSEQKKNTARNLDTLHTMKAMAGEAEAVLTGDGDLQRFGELLHESWMLKRSLSSGISNDAIDAHYQAARDHGATGGKLLGAGGRGFLLVWAPPETHDAIRQGLDGLLEVDFRCCPEGSRIIFQAPE